MTVFCTVKAFGVSISVHPISVLRVDSAERVNTSPGSKTSLVGETVTFLGPSNKYKFRTKHLPVAYMLII